MRVLVVDDAVSVRDVLKRTLEAEKFQVFLAADGAEALDILRAVTVDAIVTDILMPRVDGYRLCYEVRKDPRFRKIPIIVHSGTYILDTDEQLALQFGADKFIRKSGPIEEILAALRDLSASGRIHLNPPPPAPEGPAAELEIMKEYSTRLVEKLEERNAALERRKQMLTESNDQLMRSEEKFRGIIENMQDAFFRIDARGTIEMISPSIDRYGYSRYELLGSSLGYLCSDTGDWPGLLDKLTGGAPVVDLEIQLRTRDGRMTPAAINARARKDQDGALLGAEGLIHDTTERKRLQDHLQQAQKMEAVGMLAGGIAHDFNNLLTAIIGYADLAEERLGDQEDPSHEIREIGKAGRRAAALTRQLLAFSRKRPAETRVLSLNELVNDTTAMLRRLMPKDVVLTTNLAPDAGPVTADAGKMEQVILNLAINARDAMPDGGRLVIETKTVEDALPPALRNRNHSTATPAYVLLSLTDSGLGMDNATMSRIFEPFFTTKEAGKGTGLGLSTVSAIVRELGGHIEVRSRLGGGTAFDVYIPRAIRFPDSRTEAPSALLTKGWETILLVEDEAAVRALARMSLEYGGYVVFDARDAKAAINICKSHSGPIHLAITDLMMPKVNGIQLADTLLSLRKDMRILFMSGYAEDSLIRTKLAPGAHFLQKPFGPATLCEKVREVLEHSA